MSQPADDSWGIPCLQSCVIYLGGSGVFLLFVRCAFYYGTIFIIFIGAHSSGFRGLAWSTPQTPRAPPALLVGGAMEADACKHNGSAPGSAPHPVYVHLLFYLACSHFAATICRHNKLPIIFSFHISVIDFAARRRAKSKGGLAKTHIRCQRQFALSIMRIGLTERKGTYPLF